MFFSNLTENLIVKKKIRKKKNDDKKTEYIIIVLYYIWRLHSEQTATYPLLFHNCELGAFSHVYVVQVNDRTAVLKRVACADSRSFKSLSNEIDIMVCTSISLLSLNIILYL